MTPAPNPQANLPQLISRRPAAVADAAANPKLQKKSKRTGPAQPPPVVVAPQARFGACSGWGRFRRRERLSRARRSMIPRSRPTNVKISLKT